MDNEERKTIEDVLVEDESYSRCEPCEIQKEKVEDGDDDKDYRRYNEVKTYFDYTDDYEFITFQHDIALKTFKSMEKMTSYITKNIKRVAVRVLGQKSLYVIKSLTDFDNILIRDKFDNIELKYFEEVKDGTKLRTISLNKYISTNYNCMDSFNNIVFKPHGIGMNMKTSFNTFSGFQAKYIQDKKYDIKVIEPILFHLRNVICRDNQLHFTWLLSWLRYTFTNLKTMSSIFIKGRQGSGKSGWIERFLIPFVFGKRLSHYEEGLESLIGSFNSQLIGKKFALFNELHFDGGNIRGIFDKIKGIITGSIMCVNQKGIPKFQTNNNLDCIFVSNHDSSFHIDIDDRRYFVVETDPKYIGNKKYFNKLEATFNQETANVFFSYIIDLKPDEVVCVRTVPITEAKEELKTMCFNSMETFIDNLKSGETDICSNPEEKEEQKRIYLDGDMLKEVPLKIIYSNYKKWCENNGMKSFGCNKFSPYLGRVAILIPPKTEKKKYAKKFDLSKLFESS